MSTLARWVVVFLILGMAACDGGGSSSSSSSAAPTYTVGGTVANLSGTLVLQNNGGNDLSLTTNGAFTFTTTINAGSAYGVTIKAQPLGQTCTVSNGAGTMSGSNVTNVEVACLANTYTVGGTISGLTSSGLVLQNNGSNHLTIAANSGGFTFDSPTPSGSSYSISVLTQPSNPNQICTVTNGNGTVTNGDVATVNVACVTTIATLSSFALIDNALVLGALDKEDALTYKIFAMYGDPRLPAQFTGNDEGIIDTATIDELAASFENLSTNTQNILGPFLLRPNIQGGWADSSTAAKTSTASDPHKNISRVSVASRPPCEFLASREWGFEEREGIPVRVWWTQSYQPIAAALADEMKNKIWPALLAVGATMPLDDVNNGRTVCYGGDGKLDVYLVDLAMRGLTVPEGVGIDAVRVSPVHILLRRDFANDPKFGMNYIYGAMAHELMHAIQWANKTQQPQSSYGWIRDALANWAVDVVYGQTLQLEQEYASCFTTTPELSLDDVSTGHCKNTSKTTLSGAERNYGAYLYFQYLAKSLGSNIIGGSVLRAMGRTDSGIKAVDAAYPFKDHWSEFGKRLWNRTPVDTKPDSFKLWDNLGEQATLQLDTSADLGGKSEDKIELDSEVNVLSNRYYHFMFSDANTRSILFFNGFFEQHKSGKAIKVLALWLDDAGNWQEEDWSQYQFVGLCRDLKSQRAQELTIIVSNGELEPADGHVTAPQTPYLKRSNLGCWKYSGTATATTGGLGSGLGKRVQSNLVFQLDAAATSTFGTDPNIPDSLRAYFDSYFALIGQNYTLEESYDFDGCHYSFGPATFSVRNRSEPVAAGALNVNIFKEIGSIDQDPHPAEFIAKPRAYSAHVIDSQEITVTVTGGNCKSSDTDLVGYLLEVEEVPESGSSPVAGANGTLSGSYTLSVAERTLAFTWSLTPQSEP